MVPRLYLVCMSVRDAWEELPYKLSSVLVMWTTSCCPYVPSSSYCWKLQANFLESLARVCVCVCVHMFEFEGVCVYSFRVVFQHPRLLCVSCLAFIHRLNCIQARVLLLMIDVAMVHRWSRPVVFHWVFTSVALFRFMNDTILSLCVLLFAMVGRCVGGHDMFPGTRVLQQNDRKKKKKKFPVICTTK